MSATIRWLGQGGFEVSKDGLRVLIDPYLSDLVERQDGHKRLVPAPITAADLADSLVIATHDHIDHFDTDTLTAANPTASVFAGPDSCLDHFRQIGIPEENLRAFSRGKELVWGQLALTAVHAEHTKDSIGVVLQTEDLRVYFTADTLDSPLLREAGRGCDMLVTCVNGRWGNMGSIEAAHLALDLGVRCAIPVHYGMFAANTADPLDFVRALKGSGIRVPLMKHGVAYPLRGLFETSYEK